MSDFKSMDSTRKRSSGTSTAPPSDDVAGDLALDRRVPSSTTVELVEASWVGSSWDLLTGLDVVESAPGKLFDEFFDSQSGAARDPAQSGDLSKDQWLLAFAVELAELDRNLEPRDVIRLAKLLWRKKQHLPPEVVARDAFSTGWMIRQRLTRERS